MTVGYSLSMALAWLLLAEPLVGMFLSASDPSFELAVFALRWVGVYMTAMAMILRCLSIGSWSLRCALMTVVLTGAMRGANDTSYGDDIDGVHPLVLGRDIFSSPRIISNSPRAKSGFDQRVSIGYYDRLSEMRRRCSRVNRRRLALLVR